MADSIDDLAQGYQSSQLLLTANRLGLFKALATDCREATELASELAASPRGLRILCDALVALGLLDRTPDGYCNGTAVRRHLLPDSPEPRIDLLLHAARQYERWGRLFDAVRTGQPVPNEAIDSRLVADEEAFARAMADVGRRSAAATCEQLDLADAHRLLDIGGGPGIYAIEFARRWPELAVTILDRAPALAVASQNIEAAGLEHRIGLLAGDALHDSLAGPWDVIFVSNFIHIYAAAENRRLIDRCAQSLVTSGRLILKDFFLDPDRRQPITGAIFAVNMLVSTETGDCYSIDEVKNWLEDAGLRLEGIRNVAEKSRLMVAIRER